MKETVERGPASVPQDIADLIDAPRFPSVSLSPDRRWLLVLEDPGPPEIAELTREELRLAGVRLDPRNNARSRTSYFVGPSLLEVGSRRRDVGRRGVEGRGVGGLRALRGLPEGARIASLEWSPDSRLVALALLGESDCRLWLAEAESGECRELADLAISSGLQSGYTWTPDSHSLVCLAVPPQRGPRPLETDAYGPQVQEHAGGVSPTRTFQDLLSSPYEEELFEHFFTSQVVRVGLDGETQTLGRAGIHARAEPSPDGRWLLVETVHRPFSYVVPWPRFPRRVEVWRADGMLAATLAELPLEDSVAPEFDSVRPGLRAFDWRDDVPATLVWAEALDGGDSTVDAELRDAVRSLEAPFEGEPRTLLETRLRYRGMSWGSDGLAVLRERWWKTRQERVWLLRPDEGDEGQAPEVLFERSFEDRYSDPGTPMTRRNAAGRRVLLRGEDDATLFLSGEGASEEGARPFVDKFDLSTRETKRIWQSAPSRYEAPVTLLGSDRRRLLLRRESMREPPNFFVRPLDASEDGSADEPLTDFPHPTPALRDARKQLLRYRRGDGVWLTATLYTPPGYREEDGPLPTILWAYPSEFKSAAAAGQLTRSPDRFVYVPRFSPLLWLAAGYAVLYGPTLPIVGEEDVEPNDTYVEQLVAGATAAVEEIVGRGVADRARLVAAGHSYGGFMAANLLAHTDLFCAGIALSGAYNRTLTPFGFQSEERTLWQAREVYSRMSPFMMADSITAPLLLIHGAEDENPGTHVLQSERMYQALKGLGRVARLVILPHEGHGYLARESLHAAVGEIHHWLSRYAPANMAE